MGAFSCQNLLHSTLSSFLRLHHHELPPRSILRFHTNRSSNLPIPPLFIIPHPLSSTLIPHRQRRPHLSLPPALNSTHSHTSQQPILHKYPLKSQSQYPTPAITVSSDQPSSHRHASNAAVSTHRRHQISCSFYDYTLTRLYLSLDIAGCIFCGR